LRKLAIDTFFSPLLSDHIEPVPTDHHFRPFFYANQGDLGPNFRVIGGQFSFKLDAIIHPPDVAQIRETTAIPDETA
jgi:hypothetical protein